MLIPPERRDFQVLQPKDKALEFWNAPTRLPLEQYGLRPSEVIINLESLVIQGFTDTVKAVFRKLPEGTMALFLQYQYMERAFSRASGIEGMKAHPDRDKIKELDETKVGFRELVEEEVAKLGLSSK